MSTNDIRKGCYEEQKVEYLRLLTHLVNTNLLFFCLIIAQQHCSSFPKPLTLCIAYKLSMSPILSQGTNCCVQSDQRLKESLERRVFSKVCRDGFNVVFCSLTVV